MKDYMKTCVSITLMFALISCHDGVVTFTGGTATMRFFNGQTKVSSIQCIIDSTVVAVLSPGQLSQPYNVPSGMYVQFETYSGNAPRVRIASQRYVMADRQSYTLVVRGETITDFLRPIIDTTTIPYNDRVALKLVNLSDEFVALRSDVGSIMLQAEPHSVTVFNILSSVTRRVSIIDPGTDSLYAGPIEVDWEFGKCYYVFFHPLKRDSVVTYNVFAWKVH